MVRFYRGNSNICAAMGLVLFTVLKLDVIYLVFLSFILFAISWKFYDRFKNA